MPRLNLQAGSPQRIQSLRDIANFLDVERSARYLPTATSTYCNIYAYDYCYLARAYLPRVWWTSKALLSLAKGQRVPVQYGQTVTEQNANMMFDWLNEWGDDFGWVRCFDLAKAQSWVNDGSVAIICAKRIVLTRSGHITVIVPEAPPNVARRDGSRVLGPVQSQAGTRNKKVFELDWWVQSASNYRETGFWYFDPSAATLQ